MLNVPVKIQINSTVFPILILPLLMTHFINFSLFHTEINPVYTYKTLIIEPQSNLVNIGIYLFNVVPASFLMVGLILFVAIIGAIVTTETFNWCPTTIYC